MSTEIYAARKQRLNEGLWALSDWCAARAAGNHDDGTTLTMPEKKASTLRGKVDAAGWRVSGLTAHPADHLAGEGFAIPDRDIDVHEVP